MQYFDSNRLSVAKQGRRPLDEYPIGMTYVPFQKMDQVYEKLEEAFCEGTLFPQLNQPFLGRSCE